MPYLTGAEQRAEHAEEDQRARRKARDRGEPKPADRDAGGADFDELHARAIVALSNLSASSPPSAEENEEGRDEHDAGERDERLALLAADLEQDQQNQRVLEEIIVEGREELAPEQRREAARGEKRLRHG